MIRPDAIPLYESASRVTLSPAVMRTVFGDGFRARGTERVRLIGPGKGEVSLLVVTGNEIVLELDRLDASKLGGRPTRIVGPRSAVEAPPPTPIPRLLVLPGALIRAWGLKIDDRVVLELGSVLFTDVRVAEGQPAGASLDRADLLAAGVESSAVARLRRDVDAAERTTEVPRDLTPAGLITENDVRQARLHGRRITVRPGQKITPAAASLGKELGILDH